MPSLELAAAMLGLLTVWLVVRRSTWNYPFALAMVALYLFVYIEAKLYSDALLQVFFFGINLFGWWAWSRAEHIDDGVAVRELSAGQRAAWAAGAAAASLALGWIMASYTDASAPYIDAIVAGSSVAAQILQSLRRVESWIGWIVADVIAVPLFWSKGLYFTSVLYLIFLAMAVAGLVAWRRTLEREAHA